MIKQKIATENLSLVRHQFTLAGMVAKKVKKATVTKA